jgi:hypothetical protein
MFILKRPENEMLKQFILDEIKNQSDIKKCKNRLMVFLVANIFGY